MWELGMPWWEFVVRALAVYTAVLFLVRVTGKRSVAQTTPFDIILLILLGNAVQNALLGDDVSLGGGLILAVTLIAVNHVVGMITARVGPVHALLEGEPVLLARNGQVLQGVLRRQNMSMADFEVAMRRNCVRGLAEIECAWLESDGSISILKRREAQA